jgi:uncharacterized protein YceK
MKGMISALLVLLCCSCATVKTLDASQNHINISHQGKKSYCEEIPRIYSGISYNFCLMYGEPSDVANIGSTINGIPTVFIDSLFSVAADTIVLPYTITTQAKKGSIKVN